MWTPDLDPSDEPAYLAIARALERDFAEGRLLEGTQLPTHRKLARKLGLAVGTVTRAYTEAEARGIIHGQVGRGTFVGPLRRLPFHRRQDSSINLAITWPLHGLDPDLGPVLQELGSEPSVTSLLRYSPHAGHDVHRAAGSDWARIQGIPAEAGDIAVCAGVQHALLVALQVLTEPGDIVVCDSLTYPGFLALARALHLRVVGLAMDEEGIDPGELEKVCRQRRPKVLYTVPTIQNPTTAVMGAERRRRVVEIADASDLTILEDDVHRLLQVDPPPTFYSMLPQRTYSIASLSKVVCGGLRVAYLASPPGKIEEVASAVWASAWMTAPLCAEIARRWIIDGTASRTAERKRKEARHRQGLARQLLAGMDYQSTEASYHLWMQTPKPWRADDFCLAAEREGVSLTPASSFATNGDADQRGIRVSLTGAETRTELEAGLKILKSLAERPAKRSGLNPM
jgi:DNA-binding transcriptional MocR family regulator